MLPLGTPRARRYVDRRRDRTTVTRQSAPARIGAPAFLTAEPILTPLEAVIAAGTPVTRPQLPVTAENALRNRNSSKPVTAQPAASDASSDDSGDESDTSYSSFVLNLEKKDILGPDARLNNWSPWGHSFSTQSTSPEPDIKLPDGILPTTYRVLKSHYEGELFRNSKLNAQLIVGPTQRPDQAGFMDPLFKWIHVENPEMNFGAFLEYTSRCPYLDDSERSSVESILRTSREKSDRSLRRPIDMRGTYVEPEYFEERIESTVYWGPRGRRSRKETVRWMAMPYFYLPKSSSKKDTAVSGAVSKVQQYTKRGYFCKGDFFQIAQLWWLTIGDNVMLSCARMAISDLPGHLINFTHIPPSNPNQPFTGDREPMLQVTDGGLRMWLLPLDQCETWPAFVTNFITLGFSLLHGWQVKYRDVVLDSKDWDSVVAIARKTSVKLELCRKDPKASKVNENDDEMIADAGTEETETPSTDPESGIKFLDGVVEARPPSPIFGTSNELPLEYVPTNPSDGSSTAHRSETTLRVDEFHVFTLLATVPATAQPTSKTSGTKTGQDTSAQLEYTISEQQLQRDLTELDHYFSSRNSRLDESVGYGQCGGRTTYDVERSVLRLDPSDRENFRNKRTFVKSAGKIFELFFPLRYEHTITKKFWGSVDTIVQKKGADADFSVLVKEVLILAKVAKMIKGELFSERQLSDYTTSVPHEFVQAWMLLQMSFVSYASTSDNVTNCPNHLRRCKERLLQGRLKMVERLQPINIRQREAVMPLGVTVLLLGQLLHDSQGPLTPERHRLTSAYWDFFKDFKVEVHRRPLSRKYETTFTKLKSEFETIIATLEDQQRVLIALQDSIDEAESHSFASNLPKLHSKSLKLEPSREASVTEYLIQQTSEMLQNFWEMSRRLNELENWHFLSVSIDKDKQDRASFTFTTVTVFFLPLTTLASILGMNTSDIRDMADTQWVFWAVAVPICAASLGIWMFYLHSFNVMRSGWWKEKKAGAQFRKDMKM